MEIKCIRYRVLSLCPEGETNSRKDPSAASSRNLWRRYTPGERGQTFSSFSNRLHSRQTWPRLWPKTLPSNE